MTDILILEDTEELASLLRDFLLQDGYRVNVAYSGENGLKMLKKNGARMVILDIMLPDMDGFEVCRIIREQFNMPIFIISARTYKEDKLNGLTLGADDYIEKPFDIDVLTAKVKACFNRNYPDDRKQLITAENISINSESHTLTVGGKVISCTVKEFELLKLLMENKGKALSKEYIFDRIWGSDSFSEQSTLTVHIKWLRDKIEPNPKKPQRILTVWGVGYKFEK